MIHVGVSKIYRSCLLIKLIQNIVSGGPIGFFGQSSTRSSSDQTTCLGYVYLVLLEPLSFGARIPLILAVTLCLLISFALITHSIATYRIYRLLFVG